MKQKIDVEKIKNEISSYLKDDTFLNYSEDENSSTIHLYFNKDNLYDAFSKSSLLNPDIYESVQETLSYVDKKKKVKFEFHFSEDISSEEKERVKKAFKAHYAQEVLRSKKQSFKNKILALVLLLVGAIFLIVDGILLALGNQFIFQNIIEIVAWVFIWEAANVFFFENASTRKEWVEYVLIFQSEIVLK